MKNREFVAYQGDSFTIEWYHDSAGKSQALSYFTRLAEKSQNKFLFLLKRMGDFGFISDKTKFRNEGDGIFAFKPQPDRYLCFFFKGKKIIITNAFVKKSNKLPMREKMKSTEYMNDYVSRVKTGEYYG
jgi:phage-related protein